MQEQLQNVLKQNLKDIHLPSEVGLWPLAPAWWLLLALLVMALLGAILWFRRYRAANRYRATAIAMLDQSFTQWQEQKNASVYLHSANSLLRRCVLHNQSKSDDHQLSLVKKTIGQTGKAWIDTLHSISKQILTEQTQTALTINCYQKNPKVDIESIHPELCAWIKNHRQFSASEPLSKASSRRPNV